MEIYISLDKISVISKTVYLVENKKDRLYEDNDLIGSVVIIDTTKYKVVGVESPLSPIIKKGEIIGLSVIPI